MRKPDNDTVHKSRPQNFVLNGVFAIYSSVCDRLLILLDNSKSNCKKILQNEII